MLFAWDIIKWLYRRPKMFIFTLLIAIIIGSYVAYDSYYVRDLSDRDDIRVSTIVNGNYRNTIVTIPAHVSVEETFYDERVESSIAKVRIKDDASSIYGYIYKIDEDGEGRDDYLTARDYPDKLVYITGEIKNSGTLSFMNVEHIDI